MPSKKPTILVRTTDEIKEKLEQIALKDKRSLSNLAELILENYIHNYENQNGTIITGNANKSVNIGNDNQDINITM